MPWNAQGGGPWGGGGGQGPWGGRPGGGQQPPDLEELLRRSQEKVRSLFPGGGGPGNLRRGLAVVAALVVVVLLVSSVFRVQPDEKGVVLRFGELNRVVDPGLHLHWPWPVERVIRPKVTLVNRIEVGFRTGQTAGVRTTSSREVSDESLMLTGDENIVDINFVVQWLIGDPAQYLFNIRDAESTVKAAAESVMREIVGRTPIVEITTEGRGLVESTSKEELQRLMTDYGTGILVTEVQLQKADPPQEVIDAFRDVQRAQADRERAQNEAEAFANDIIPRARGEAERVLQDSEAYKQEVVARASGEADRFKSVLTEYTKAQDITTRRIYLETMEQVLKGGNKVILDGQGGNGVVPYLPLPELQRRAPGTGPQGASQ